MSRSSFSSVLRFASSLLALAPLAACGSAADESVAAPRPDDHLVIVAPPPAADAGAIVVPASCAGDADCAASDLCVDGTCRRACHDDRACAAGTCHTETDGGWCYNAPGCNPPPAGVMCPTLCFGYCM